MWSTNKPQYGDHIRVNRGLYYHHGIYVSDEYVINFASTKPGYELDPNSASVCIVSLKDFLKNGMCEVRIYTAEEEKIKRNNQDKVNYAFTKIGSKGYNLLNNNCEHFANECVFGKKRSEQIDNIKKIFN